MYGIARCCLYVSLACTQILTVLSLAFDHQLTPSLRRGELNVNSSRHAADWEARYTCGEGFCRCQGVRADCSGRVGHYIPRLPPQITFLNLSRNFIFHIMDEDFFTNATNITELDLSLNYITFINMTAFNVLKNLTWFSLDFNSRLDCDFLSGVRNITTLETLSVRGCFSQCDMREDIEVRNPMPSLQTLDLGYNDFNMLNLSCLTPFVGLRTLYLDYIEWKRIHRVIIMYSVLGQLSNLTYLSLKENNLNCTDLLTVFTIYSLEYLSLSHSTDCHILDVKLKRFKFMSRLVTVDLSNNKLMKVTFIGRNSINLSFNESNSYEEVNSLPNLKTLILRRNQLRSMTVCKGRSSIFPSIEKLDFSENSIGMFYPKDSMCFRNVQFLNLSGNQFEFTDPEYALTIDLFHRLDTLDVSAQAWWQTAKGLSKQAFRNPHLKSLILDGNLFPFKNETLVHADSFSSCSNLLRLSLANTDLKGVSEKRFQQLFGKLEKLRELSLRSTGFRFFTAGVFQSLKSLESLDISDNSILILPDGAFPALPRLLGINASFNKISVVSESAFPFPTKQRLQRVDLSANPFMCSCQVLWFQKWFLSRPFVFAGSSSDYTCANLPDTSLQSFFMQEQACLLSQQTSQFIIAIISLIFIGMSLVSLLYRFRWHIRLVLFEAFRGQRDRLRRLQEHHFQYDVFVSYDSDDFHWVCDHLMPILEGRMGIKLCLHHRDFILGKPIMENINECVETSKKMLMVFSKAFTESQWCQFELRLCLTHAMDTDDALIVVMLEDIPHRDLTPAMMAVMKTTTYIEWADDDDARNYFWQRMKLALNEILNNE